MNVVYLITHVFDHRRHPGHHQKVKTCKLIALNVTKLSLIITLTWSIMKMSMFVDGVEQSRDVWFNFPVCDYTYMYDSSLDHVSDNRPPGPSLLR